MKIIQLAIKYCKKSICIILIISVMISSVGFTRSKTEYKIDESTKIELLNQAKVVDWNSFDDIMSIGSRFIIVDYYTGTYFVCERHMGGLHADVEQIDKEATRSLKSLYKDRENWKHRPVLIVFEDKSVYCASSFIVGHAGRDDKKFLEMVDNRSSGYGMGENYDFIKGNDLDGHICVHVLDCRNHFDGRVSEKHQVNIDYLKQEKLKLK